MRSTRNKQGRHVNPLDTLIVIIVLVSIVAGYRRGFIVGSYDVVVAIVSLLVAAIAYRPISAGLSAALDLQDPVANLAGFVIAYLIVGAPGALLVRPLVRWFRSITGIIPGVHPSRSPARYRARSHPGIRRGVCSCACGRLLSNIDACRIVARRIAGWA